MAGPSGCWIVQILYPPGKVEILSGIIQAATLLSTQIFNVLMLWGAVTSQSMEVCLVPWVAGSKFQKQMPGGIYNSLGWVFKAWPEEAEQAPVPAFEGFWSWSLSSTQSHQSQCTIIFYFMEIATPESESKCPHIVLIRCATWGQLRWLFQIVDCRDTYLSPSIHLHCSAFSSDSQLGKGIEEGEQKLKCGGKESERPECLSYH